jgi:nicotinamide mononucleotide (NMN) deamidase PncC
LKDRAEQISKLALERCMTLATVESCTAGSLAQLLSHAEVAQAMAEGGLARCPADIVVAITGVAGPEPDEDGNPVGRVVVAAAARDGRKSILHQEFGQISKEEICSGAMGSALGLIEQLLRAQVP